MDPCLRSAGAEKAARFSGVRTLSVRIYPHGGDYAMRGLLVFTVIAISVVGCSCISQAQEEAVSPTKPISHGVYVDRDGVKHRWYVNPAHTLIWDEKPYLPVGGMYCPPYTWEQSESGWALTKAQFDMLKSKGVIDLYIHFAMSCPPENLQRMIDYLEDQEFRYGIELTSGPESGPGYAVQRRGLRVEHIEASGTYGVEVADPLGGVYLLVDEDDGRALAVGSARVYERDEPTGKILESGEPETAKKKGLETDVECPPGRKLTLYFTPQVNGGQPYFWDGGFNAYRDRLLRHFREVKFGKGFRFVVDPLHNEMNVSHDFLPSSPDYARQFSRWLAIRYKHTRALNRGWAMAAGSKLPDFQTAARLVPLRVLKCAVTGKPAESGVLYDPVEGRAYIEDARRSQVWYDMMQFSGEVYARYCSAISEFFKKKIADVPIIFKHAGPIGKCRVNLEEAGFDGIGMEPYGVGEALLPMNAAVCYSEVEQSAKTMWLLVTEFSQAAFDFQLENIGHMDRESMYADMSALLGAGAKGIFVFGLGFGPWPEGQFWMSEFLRDPRQLEWMATFRRIMENSSKLVDYRPTCYYRYPTRRQEKFTFGPLDSDFAGIEGDWTGHNGSGARAVTRAPDGTWILPTWSCSVDTPLIIANLRNSPASLRYGPALEEMIEKGTPLVTYIGFRHDLGAIPSLDKYFTDQFAVDHDGAKIQVLQPTETSEIFAQTEDGHVWNLIDGSLQIISREVEDKEGWQPQGLRIPLVDQVHEPERFLAEVLGVAEFRLEPDIRGFTFLDDGEPVTYLWSERMASSIRLAPDAARGARARYANGEQAGAPGTDGSLSLRLPLKKQPEMTEQPAPYVKGKHYATENWREALVLAGVPIEQVFDAEELLPVYWNPAFPPEVWVEGEDFLDSNFNLGKYSGMTKLSGGAFWGLDTFVDPSPTDGYYVKYSFRVQKVGTFDLWVREWVGKSPCQWRVNGGKWRDAPEEMEAFDRQFCGPWALFDDSKIVFAWFNYGRVRLRKGDNALEIRVTQRREKDDKYCKFFDALAFTADGAKPWESVPGS